MNDAVLVVDYAVEQGVAVLSVDNPPVNALSAAVRKGLQEAVKRANADPDVALIVIICRGKTFFAGADITELGRPVEPPALSALINQIEASAKPVIAAIHGTALGGGLELALGCRFRVAVPSARLGLPEVKLGLLAGAGGTQRLPRAVGVEQALTMMTGGDALSARDLADSGLIDALIDEGALRQGAIAFARRVIDEGLNPLPVSQRQDRIAEARADRGIVDRFRQANAKKFKGFDAPEANLQAIGTAIDLPYEAGIARERALFIGLLEGDQSKALRHVFFAERAAAKVEGLAQGLALRTIGQVAVIGAGTMGAGIAMGFLSAGYPVTLIETNDEALARGIGNIRKTYEGSAKRGRLSTADVERLMEQLTGAVGLEAAGGADLVIEAVFEDMAIKRDVFGQLDVIARPGAILATNTSYLDVNEIAGMTSRPGDVVGMHFFSPANIMRLLEIVRGDHTAPDVLATVLDVAKRIGKVGVVSGVCYGFIGNRMLSIRRRESRALLLDGYMPWEIDAALEDFGMPMGPYAMADLAGLDIGWAPGKSSGDPLRDRFCEVGRFGQKRNAGFYDYDENRRRSPSTVADEIVRAFVGESDRPQRQLDRETMVRRMLYPMINEGAKILEEGIAARASDIDVVWINGYGWPKYRGGPMFYGDLVGIGHVVETLDRFAEQYGAELAPAESLRALARTSGRLLG